MPAWARRCGGWLVMSAPETYSLPLSADSRPVMRLISVVLPEPLGPMMPRIWPLVELKSHVGDGAYAAEAFGEAFDVQDGVGGRRCGLGGWRRWRWRGAWGLGEDAGAQPFQRSDEAPGSGDDRRQQCRAVEDEVAAFQPPEPLRQVDQEEGSDDGSGDAALAADDGDGQDRDHDGEFQHFGRDDALGVGRQRSGGSAIGGADGEGFQPQPVDVDAQGSGGVGRFPHDGEGGAAPAVAEAP